MDGHWTWAVASCGCNLKLVRTMIALLIAACKSGEASRLAPSAYAPAAGGGGFSFT
jgi:hypothetical protein